MIAANDEAWQTIAALMVFAKIIGLVVVSAADDFRQAFLVVIGWEVSRMASCASLIHIID